jgi:hypothetical protein
MIYNHHQINRHNTLMTEQNQHLSVSTGSIDGDLDISTDMYYKLPCPCSTTRQLLIKFHFARPSFPLSKWLCCCCCCCIKNESPINHDTPITSQTEDEAVTILTPTVQINSTSASNSDTLRRQLHRHRIQQLRMASTFLIITVSFVLFYKKSYNDLLFIFMYTCIKSNYILLYESQFTRICYFNVSLSYTTKTSEYDRWKNIVFGTLRLIMSFFSSVFYSLLLYM